MKTCNKSTCVIFALVNQNLLSVPSCNPCIKEEQCTDEGITEVRRSGKKGDSLLAHVADALHKVTKYLSRV